MSVPRNMLKELVERKLWPIALVLIIALVAVPVLLTKRAPTDIVTPPTGPLPYSSGTTLPAISVQTRAGQLEAHRQGPQSVHSAAGRHDGDHRRGCCPRPRTTASTGASTGTATVSAGTGSASSRERSEQHAGRAGPGPCDLADPDARPRPRRSTPASTGLTATQSYHVSLAITTSGGGVNTIDPLERLSILPSKQQPMLVELGVLQGGHSVLFAVEPGTVVSGAGTCTPGPIDCEILTLNPGQTEGISKQSRLGLDPGCPVLGELDHGRSAPVGRRRQQGSPDRIRCRPRAAQPLAAERPVPVPVRPERRRRRRPAQSHRRR